MCFKFTTISIKILKKKKKKKPYMEYTDKKRRRRGSAHMPIQRINSKKHQNCINNNNVLKN